MALRLFYAWAAAEYGVANPHPDAKWSGPTAHGSARRATGNGFVGGEDRDVKWFDPLALVGVIPGCWVMGFTLD